MTGRKMYEVYTREMGKCSYRTKTQAPDLLVAWDDLHWSEQWVWTRMAQRIKGTKRPSE